MKFDWSKESIAKCFKKAEEFIEKNNLGDFLLVNKDTFGIARNKARIYCYPISRTTNSIRWLDITTKYPNIKAAAKNAYEDEDGENYAPLFIHPVIEFDLEELAERDDEDGK